jgi:dTDP-4-dehydrorhamnose 3,5-epimerase
MARATRENTGRCRGQRGGDARSRGATHLAIMGQRDVQTVRPGGARSTIPKIEGVEIFELGNVLTRSGFMTEIFRTDWPGGAVGVRQVNWAELNSGGVTDWHAHARQTDRLVGVGGVIKLALWDGRAASPTKGASEIVRFGAIRPVLVVVPPGVWHGLRNESGEPAGYLNIIDELYVHEEPDSWRLPAGSTDIPDIL